MAFPYSLIKTAITGDILDATDYNNEHQNHINNNIPGSIGGASADVASMQATATPGSVGSESLATDLLGEIKRLRYMMVQMAGGTYWYSTVAKNLAQLLPLSGGTMSGNIVMGANKLTGLAAGSTNGDSLRYEQLIGQYLLLTGGTLSGALTITPTTNQLVLGTTRTVTVSASQPASSSRTYTFPDAGADANVILSAGTPTMAANLAMGTHKLTGLAAGSTAGDSLRYEQLIGVYLPLAGGTMAGAIAMGANKITGVANGSASDDVAAFGQIPTVPTVTSGTFTPTPANCGTIANAQGFYQRIGNMVHAWGSFKTGTTAAGILSLNVPTGSITYASRLSTGGSIIIGTWWNRHAAENPFSAGQTGVIFADGTDTAKVYATETDNVLGTEALLKQNGSAFLDSNAYQSFDFWYAVA